MRSSLIVLIVLLVACGGKQNRRCTPVASFGSPVGECVALEEPPKPPPPPPKVKEKEPEPEPEPPPPEPEPPPPEPPPTVVVTKEKIELDRTVQFESGKAKLIEDSKNLLDDVTKVMIEHDEIKLVQVEGHTDAVGSDRKNKKLSLQRANAVRSYLIQKGVAKGRLIAKGFGEAKPVADNGTEEGRFKNRRVDLKILKRDDSGDEKKGDDEKKSSKVDDEADDEKKTDDEADEEAAKPKAKAKKKKTKKSKKKAPAAESE